LIISLLILAVGGTVGFFLYDQVLGFLKHPYCELPAKRRFPGAETGQCALVFTGVLDGFTTRLKVSVIVGAIGTAPFWLYQLWAFVTPGLHRKERRYALSYVSIATALFLSGAALAYVTLRKGLSVLIGTAGAGTQALLTINSYLSFVVLMLLAFGAAFQVPLLVIMLNRAGVLPYALLRRSQRMAIFLLFVFAAVATPSGDPFTMTALAVPLVLLFELAVLIARAHDKRKAAADAAARQRNQAEDDLPSALSPFADPID
ncbi:MAG: twin-arginine translocase subunit TatC, partial [Frankiaceae bacterium]|nr:twin-arginine translocase subunit TatC [Frankiaceae bacterium]